jgi:hypothetical protein
MTILRINEVTYLRIISATLRSLEPPHFIDLGPTSVISKHPKPPGTHLRKTLITSNPPQVHLSKLSGTFQPSKGHLGSTLAILAQLNHIRKIERDHFECT